MRIFGTTSYMTKEEERRYETQSQERKQKIVEATSAKKLSEIQKFNNEERLIVTIRRRGE